MKVNIEKRALQYVNGLPEKDRRIIKQHLLQLEPQTREQELRDYLGGFDFRGAMADRPVAPFSGGKKSRLALALLVRRRR